MTSFKVTGVVIAVVLVGLGMHSPAGKSGKEEEVEPAENA